MGKVDLVGVEGDVLVVEAIEAAAPGLARVALHQELEAGVDIDDGDNAHHLQQVHQRCAIRGVLVERLLK